ncbi:PIN domain-containing protein [Arthrobacter sulfonylureivorans]|uniref:PIN domain-containing protein n=1 Tax=Arthrobacter sulfonylureivorans TaxID=2486855 RepID=UPI0039E6605D
MTSTTQSAPAAAESSGRRRARGLLLDTDVVAELRRENPDPAVVEFLQRRRRSRVYISALTLGELHALSTQDSALTGQADAWLVELTERFAAYILPVDLQVAAAWAPLAIQDVPAVESLIAATAVKHCLTVVSGNAEGYRRLSVEACDPWQQPGAANTGE